MLKTIRFNLKLTFRNVQYRFGSNNASAKPKDKMEAWQIHSYGGLEELKLSSIRIPVITRPTDVLVKVEASSVNSIDVFMTRGYGAVVLNFVRKLKSLTGVKYDKLELPMTLGRDFSGIIVSKGHGVGKRLKLEDEVWGVVPVDQPGCHANYVVVNSSTVAKRPKNISYIEAASILYAGLTAWSSLWLTGALCCKVTRITKRNNKVLILGGSGGVGTVAVQLLKAWNMHVVATCSAEGVPVIQKLGADVALDFKQEDVDSIVIAEGPYNIIFDCANLGADYVRSKGYPHSTYITLNSPVLRNTDQHGLIVGTMKNIAELIKYNIPNSQNRSSVKWGYFIASRKGIKVLQEYVECGKIVPVVQKVYKFHELPLAYDTVVTGHMTGKIVIDMR